jgi:nucleoside phosphorylase
MEEPPQFFDICIVCALHEEARAVIDEFSRRCHISFTKAHHGLDHYEYQYTTIQNRDKESLTVLVTWLPEMGPPAMAQEVKSLVQQFHPRFMAMTGICAGDQRKVQLGDLIVASAAYHYEEGICHRRDDAPTKYPDSHKG